MGDKRLIDNEWITIDECYEKHKRFITRLTTRYRAKGMNIGLDFEDVRGLVYVGFVKSYYQFDQERGNKFVTLLAAHVFGEVSKGMRDYGHNVHFTRVVKDAAMSVFKNEWQKERPEYIAEQLEITYQEATEALTYLGYTSKSFDAPSINPTDNSETSYHDLYGKTQDHFPIYWNEFVSNLNDEEKSVIALRKQDKNQKSIGEELGFKQVEISRKLKKIKQKYKQYQKGEMIS